MKINFPLMLFIVTVAWGIFPLNQVKAQGSVEILEQTVDFLFNDWLHFSARFDSSESLQEGFVFFQFAGSEQVWVFEGELENDQTLDVQVQLSEDNSPPPFTELEYWYRFASDHGEIFESQHYTLYYDDNRYTWQVLEYPPFVLYWHHGDLAFGQSILAAAQQGEARARQLLPLAELEDVVLRVYDNAQDVQLIARQAGFTWQAGHTDPQAGLILLSLPAEPQGSLEIQRQVPHEIAHLMLYQSLGAAYYRLPNWLNEGIASNAEIYSDPEQAEMMDLANAGGNLIPFSSLCRAFPQDGASARLAYAQSASFIRYLFDQYNQVGFSLMVDAYAKSDDCVAAPVQDFGKDLVALDADWRAATFTQDEGILAWFSAAPWRAILVSAGIAFVIFLSFRFVRIGRK